MINSNFEIDIFPLLESEGFILREVEEKDYISVFETYSQEATVKYQQISAMETMDQAKKSVQAFLQGFKNRKFIRWCIAEKENDKVIGFIALHDFDICNSQAEIGYMLNQNYWRQNVMSEVAQVIISFAFEVIGLIKIEASIHPENIASIKLCEKLGFQSEGLIKEAAFNRRTNKYEDRVIYTLAKNKE